MRSFCASNLQQLDQLWALQRGRHFRVDFGHGRVRHAARTDKAVPDHGFEAGLVEAFGEGGRVGQVGMPVAGTDREQTHLARGDLRHAADQRGQRHVHLSGDGVDHLLAGALVWGERDAQVERELELFHVEVARGADTRGGVIQPAGVLLRVGDHFRHRPEGRVVVGDQDQGRGRDPGDRREVLDRVVGHGALQVRRSGERRMHHHQDGIAVRRGGGTRLHPDHAAGTLAILDEEAGAGLRRHPLGKRARDGVEARRRPERDDDAHRLVRIGVGGAHRRDHVRHQGQGGAQGAEHLVHRLSPELATGILAPGRMLTPLCRTHPQT